MKTCQNCGSTTFDDMEMCFDCMNTFAEPQSNTDVDESEAAIRFEVSLVNLFSYELLLRKLEGRSLGVGSAAENAIVIPYEEAADHQLEVFYAHGDVWVENLSQAGEVTLDERSLRGKERIEPGSQICIGNACITLCDMETEPGT